MGDALGVFGAGQRLRQLRLPYVRAINYHQTPTDVAANFRSQLAFYKQHFANADRAALDRTIDGSSTKPAIAISFDDGYRDNYEIAAPLLEEYGFTGWFFVSSGRVRGSAELTADGELADAFMNHAEMRDLIARGHVVGCHGHSHIRLTGELSEAELHREIVASRLMLQDALGDPIDEFCWIGGEEWSYSAAAARMIEEAGYRRSFMTNCQIIGAGTDPLALQRTNIEANWSLSQTRFYLSGVMDIAYRAKHRRVATKLRKTLSHA